MSTLNKRVQLMKALVLSSPAFGPSRLATLICEEFEEVAKASRLSPEGRRFLLQVLHSTRALDTSLKTFVSYYGITCTTPSLGGYLRALETASSTHRLQDLSPAQRLYYQRQIVGPRNRYMHEAGAAPASHHELLALLSEMQACLSEVLNL